MSLTDLAQKILTNAKMLDERGLVDPESKLGFRNLSPTDYNIRSRLIDAIQELNRLALGPAEYLYSLYMTGCIQMVGLHAVARYNIPQKIPNDGIKIKDLGNELRMDEMILGRLVRQAIVHGIFQEPEPDFITHSNISRLLRDDSDWLHLAQFYTEDSWAAAALELDALEKWPASHDPCHTGFNLAHKTTDPFFDALGSDSSRLKRVAGMFRAVQTMLLQGPDKLTSSPLWNEIDKPGSKVVDIGGNSGYISQQLAEVTKDVCFVVQDRPEVVRMAEEQLPAAFRSRISFRAHDFFHKQPIRGAQIYFIRKILHDWPDYLAIKIIQNIIPALADGSYIVICDRILPDRARSGYEEKEAR
ncbi:unnamed protein product [Alternaria sp. RS040]